MPGPAQAGGSGLLLLKPATSQALWTHTHPLSFLRYQEVSAKHIHLETNTPYLPTPVLRGLCQLVTVGRACGLCLALSGQFFPAAPFWSRLCPKWWERKHSDSWPAVFL